jgi:hypothetical protein
LTETGSDAHIMGKEMQRVRKMQNSRGSEGKKKVKNEGKGSEGM